MTRLISIALLALCATARGQSVSEDDEDYCAPPLVEVVGKHFGIENFAFPASADDERQPGTIIAAACRAWPDDARQTMASFAYLDATSSDEKHPLILALIDTRKRRVIAAYRGTIIEDVTTVLGADSFSILTALYDLAPGIRAFSLDASTHSMAQCAEGGVGVIRKLFVREPGEIRLVLDDFFLTTWHAGKGEPLACDPGSETDPEPGTESITYSLAIGSVGAHGFADLALTATSSIEGRDPFRTELRYDGRRYPRFRVFGTQGVRPEFLKWRDQTTPASAP